MTNRAAALRARLVVLPDPQAQDAAELHARIARAQRREAQAYARYLAARNEIRCVERTWKALNHERHAKARIARALARKAAARERATRRAIRNDLDCVRRTWRALALERDWEQLRRDQRDREREARRVAQIAASEARRMAEAVARAEAEARRAKARRRFIEKAAIAAAARVEHGYVYAFAHKAQGWIKIGMTGAPDEARCWGRIFDYIKAHKLPPKGWEFVGFIASTEAQKLETFIHRKLIKFRVIQDGGRTELFKCSITAYMSALDLLDDYIVSTSPDDARDVARAAAISAAEREWDAREQQLPPPRGHEAHTASYFAEADRLYADFGLPYRAEGMADFLYRRGINIFLNENLYSGRDVGDAEGCGYDLAAQLAEKCYQTMSDSQKDQTGENKDKVAAGLKALRGFLYEHTDEFNNDPLAREEAAARLAEKRARTSTRAA